MMSDEINDGVADALSSICDSPPADPTHPDCICIDRDELEAILEEECGSLLALRKARITMQDAQIAALNDAAAKKNERITVLTETVISRDKDIQYANERIAALTERLERYETAHKALLTAEVTTGPHAEETLKARVTLDRLVSQENGNG